MQQTPATREGDERAYDEQPLPDHADTAYDQPYPDDFVAENTRTESDSSREPFAGQEAEPELEREPVAETDGDQDPVAETETVPPATPPVSSAPSTGETAATDDAVVLFGTEDAEKFRLRWRELQADFVDDPKHAVEGADQLVDEVMRTLSEIFAEHKSDLEGQWRDGGETEELRVALRQYRSFFEKLLNA
jgi:hypothetical protein